MIRKNYLAAAMIVMALASCSQDNGLIPVKSDVHDVVFNTAKITAAREETGDAFSEQSRTITNLQNWTVAWNDGSVSMFGGSETGLNPNIDYVEFLASGSTNWLYLSNAQNRQVFAFSNYTEEHGGHTDLPGAHKACADFEVAASYDGLNPDMSYRGYYFQPYIIKKRLPVTGVSAEQKQKLAEAGFTSDKISTIPIANWMLSGQDEKTIQTWLAENDFLEAHDHSTGATLVCPKTHGVWNETTESYDLVLDMKHTMALVEVEVVFSKAPLNESAKTDVPISVAKIVALDSSGKEVKVFDTQAALDKNAAWTYPESNDNDVLTGVKSGMLVSSTRTDVGNCTYSAVQGNASKSLKFYMLVRHDGTADHYSLQLFSGTNFTAINFYPGSGFRFTPGKYYKIKVDCDLKDSDGSGDWQDCAVLTPLQPYGGSNTFWKK